ncbi:hypothetical protein TPHA_0C00180 [Tetrapisispora phaffii CBS 4417]|uniref:Tetrapyrrole methylase domain-containing protein n=1 Tax=Tetrapisispora phaffii (strain ATCC 24235 / CBS 4417 / NBRC 1672 / NRRL Y-8282 / UCD 70-5) TaxID=1071381 RepID=G8BQZ9_TETPH|nr:hypothetical protein TPHA_0C00180 [Tetrapisispora phaffii CBS 4417]CCE62175.1 hypothetical protein TPHA_0C00180 [Tetrapisispora phaffii CBS 4417]
MSYPHLPLIISSKIENEIHLIIGSNQTNTFKHRVKAIIESGATPIIVESKQNQIKRIQLEFKQYFDKSQIKLKPKTFALTDLTTCGRTLVHKIVDKVFLFDEDINIIEQVYDQCLKLRIPICSYQKPEYSTFNLISTFTDSKKSGLQISVTTNGQGCVLANRIKREIVNSLPENISDVVINMSRLRNLIIKEDKLNSIIALSASRDKTFVENSFINYGLSADEDVWDSSNFNTHIKEFQMNVVDKRLKRSRWLSQIMEYYPLNKLSEVRLEDLSESDFNNNQNISNLATTRKTQLNTEDYSADNKTVVKRLKLDNDTSAIVVDKPQKGSISLVGSGPGSISMLTVGALQEIKSADLVLADKLVPQTIIDLIPKDTEIFFAKKFPGHAEKAQEELLQRGITALTEGKKVIRLKQGDPYIFGRGGEEFLYFKENGFTPTVLPGISSALAATVVSKIPATQRGIADQILICTGTGRKGALPTIPEYVESRTTVFLMALHRADILTKALLENSWKPNTPIAIVERASCKDQRVTRTLLKYLPDVIKDIGSRPPGLLVAGNAVNALVESDLDDNNKYSMIEGFREVQAELVGLI